MTNDLFDDLPRAGKSDQLLAPGALLLSGFALAWSDALLAGFDAVTVQVPLRHLVTPGGQAMSVAMSNCGGLGWVSGPGGYNYVRCDPTSGKPWPVLPPDWLDLAVSAAAHAGYANFKPDACLVNQYLPGARMGLHQDRDEKDYAQPIVSVSLGLPAVFLFGGLKRTDKPQRLRLIHGDVVVWGGPARLAFHGVAPLADGTHPVWGRRRVNLTFRCAA
jgi:alkylated DNA repair protein (DNA oxidative demethylase)